MNPFLITVLVLILPAVYILKELRKQRERKKKQLSLARTYDRLVLQHKLSVEHSQVRGNRVIALDRRNKTLLLIDLNKGKEQEMCLFLPEIAASRVVEERGEQDNHIQKVYLELKHRRNPAEVRFCFYDAGTDPITDLPSSAMYALHWKTRVEVHKENQNPGNIPLEQEYVWQPS